MAFKSNFEDPGTDSVYKNNESPDAATSVPGMKPATAAPALIQPTSSASSQAQGGLLGTAEKMGGGSATAADSGNASLGGGGSSPDSSL